MSIPGGLSTQLFVLLEAFPDDPMPPYGAWWGGHPSSRTLSQPAGRNLVLSFPHPRMSWASSWKREEKKGTLLGTNFPQILDLQVCNLSKYPLNYPDPHGLSNDTWPQGGRGQLLSRPYILRGHSPDESCHPYPVPSGSRNSRDKPAHRWAPGVCASVHSRSLPVLEFRIWS